MSKTALPSLPRVPALSWEDCRLLVESVTDYAVFMLDPSGHVATWNRGAEKIKGYSADEIVGAHFSRFYPPEDVVAGKPERLLASAREFGRVEDEGWRIRKDGSRFWADVVITALRDGNQVLRGFAKVTRDLTQRRLAEEKLRASEERFHHLVDAVTDYAIFMLDVDGYVATWNVGAERTKGYARDEIVGQHFSLFYTAEDRAAGKPKRTLDTARQEGRCEDESWRVRKDGSRFWANVVVTPLRDSEGRLIGFAKVTRDLTARRAAEETERRLAREQAARAAAEEAEHRLRVSEEAALRAAERAAEAGRVKDEFLATVSHELRTPLSAILGWSSVLRGRDVNPSVSRAVDAIHRNAQAQARLIEDILDMSRVVTGKLRLDLKSTHLPTIIQEALDVVRPSAAAKGIGLAVLVRDEIPLLVADPERLRQVVWNLLSNAVKFTDRDGEISVSIEHQGSQVSVSVRDTGRGIEPDFLPHVFERFQQADSSTTRRYGGLGLGLAIVRHIVELHGGRVHAESEGPGRGALFCVTLPVRAVAPPPEDRAAPGVEQEKPASRPEQASLAGVRVLVVDDDDDARELLHDVLVGAGATVEAANSARSALEKVRHFQPHVLVSDIGMPEEDGYSLVRKVRALGPAGGGGIPSIALTAYTRAQDRMKALAAGFTTHMGKPVDPDDLVAAVTNLAPFGRR